LKNQITEVMIENFQEMVFPPENPGNLLQGGAWSAQSKGKETCKKCSLHDKKDDWQPCWGREDDRGISSKKHNQRRRVKKLHLPTRWEQLAAAGVGQEIPIKWMGGGSIIKLVKTPSGETSGVVKQ